MTQHFFSPSINAVYCFLSFIHQTFASSICHQQTHKESFSWAYLVDKKIRCSNSLCVRNSFWSNKGTSIQQRSWNKSIQYWWLLSRKPWISIDPKTLISDFDVETQCISKSILRNLFFVIFTTTVRIGRKRWDHEHKLAIAKSPVWPLLWEILWFLSFALHISITWKQLEYGFSRVFLQTHYVSTSKSEIKFFGCLEIQRFWPQNH